MSLLITIPIAHGSSAREGRLYNTKSFHVAIPGGLFHQRRKTKRLFLMVISKKSSSVKEGNSKSLPITKRTTYSSSTKKGKLYHTKSYHVTIPKGLFHQERKTQRLFLMVIPRTALPLKKETQKVYK
mgnify:CR=1 FL=1